MMKCSVSQVLSNSLAWSFFNTLLPKKPPTGLKTKQDLTEM